MGNKILWQVVETIKFLDAVVGPPEQYKDVSAYIMSQKLEEVSRLNG